MINAIIEGKWRYAESLHEIDHLIAEAVGDLLVGVDRTVDVPGDIDSRFMVSDRRHASPLDLPHNFLLASVNRRTGHGGLIWFVTAGHPVSGGIHDYVWVSDNLDPPEMDPRVVSDPGEPHYYHRCSALPIERVRMAIEEFCRTGTGERPRCIEWVEGYANGHRLDMGGE